MGDGDATSKAPGNRRKQASSAATLAVLAMIAFVQVAPALELTDLTWERRIILVFATTASANDGALTRAVQRYACQIRDRDLDIYHVDTDTVTPLSAGARPVTDNASALRAVYASSNAASEFVLIGKDGGIKARGADSEVLTEFFTLIDGMPMRRAEQQERGLDCD